MKYLRSYMKYSLVLSLLAMLLIVGTPLAKQEECVPDDYLFLNFNDLPAWAQLHWKDTVCVAGFQLAGDWGYLRARLDVVVYFTIFVHIHRTYGPSLYEASLVITDLYPIDLSKNLVYVYIVGIFDETAWRIFWNPVTTWTMSKYDLWGCDGKTPTTWFPDGLCVTKR